MPPESTGLFAMTWHRCLWRRIKRSGGARRNHGNSDYSKDLSSLAVIYVPCEAQHLFWQFLNTSLTRHSVWVHSMLLSILAMKHSGFWIFLWMESCDWGECSSDGHRVLSKCTTNVQQPETCIRTAIYIKVQNVFHLMILSPLSFGNCATVRLTFPRTC